MPHLGTGVRRRTRDRRTYGVRVADIGTETYLYRNIAAQHPGILALSASQSAIGNAGSGAQITYEGHAIDYRYFYSDYDFLETLAMRRWLENFAYRIELGPGSFVLGGIAALLLAWLTVSYQAIRAATANPVEALRYE